MASFRWGRALLIFLGACLVSAIVVHADGADYSPPCYPLSTCGSYTQEATIDFSALADKFVILTGNGDHFCSPTKYVVNQDHQFSIPRIDIDSDNGYYIIEKTYFDQQKGIDGLFYQTNGDSPYCDGKIILTPKNKQDLEQHSITLDDILVSKDDDLFSSSGANILGGQFIRTSSIFGWNMNVGVPTPITDKSYTYQPAGWYCDTVNCSLVIQRSQETWTIDKGTKEPQQLQPAAFSGLQPASSAIVFVPRSVSLDIADIKNKFVVLSDVPFEAGSFNDYCAGHIYSMISDNQLAIHAIPRKSDFYFPDNYLLIDKNYFNSAGGMHGLFESVSSTNPACMDKNLMQPKSDPSGLYRNDKPENSITIENYYPSIFVPKSDLLSYESASHFGGTSAIVSIGKETLYTLDVSPFRIAVLPDSVSSEAYQYQPVGYYCSNDPANDCKIVAEPSKEIMTMTDGTMQEHDLTISPMDGIVSLTTSPFQPTSSTPSQTPIVAPSSVIPTQTASTTSVSAMPHNSSASPTVPITITNIPILPERSFWQNVWCFITGLFGGLCN